MPQFSESGHQTAGDRVINYMTRSLGGLASVLLFCMMALTFFDVLGRYFLNAPVPGAFEVTELMLATLIFAGMPLVTARKEQVTVDLLDHLIPSSIRHIRDFFIYLVCGGLTFITGILVWRKADETLAYGDITAILNIPIAPMVYFMSIMLLLTGIVFLVLSWVTLKNK